MSSTVVNLIIQVLSGAAGSGLLVKFLNQLNLAPIGNLISGAVGGPILTAVVALLRNARTGGRTA
jgi:hypothetical protein